MSETLSQHKNLRKNKAKAASEYSEATAFMRWIRLIGKKKYPELNLLYHVPNGGKRDVRTAAQMKEMGVLAGIPDYHLPVASFEGGVIKYIGLFIELKRVGGVLSAIQIDICDVLAKMGHKVCVCEGWEAAVNAVEEYLRD